MKFRVDTLVVTVMLAFASTDAQGIRGLVKKGSRQLHKGNPDAKSNVVDDKGLGGKGAQDIDFVVSYSKGNKDGKGFEDSELLQNDFEEAKGEDDKDDSEVELFTNNDEDDKDDKDGNELVADDVEDDEDDKGKDNKDADLMASDLGEDEGEEETTTTVLALPDIVDIAMKTSSLSSLYRLVAAAGLAPTLHGPGPFTLFAPIDAAFPAGADLLKLQADPTLPTTLAYHVVPGLIRSSDLTNGQMATTIHGDDVTAYLYPSTATIMIDDAKVIYADVEASNGIVHLIDRALEPSAVCSVTQVAEFECDIMDDVVGLLVCRGGTTTCSLASEFLVGDTCGCCVGDTSRDCRNKHHGNVPLEATELAPLPPTSPSANGICSAQEVSEFACDLVEDVVGVAVCRGGVTICTLTVQTQEGDTCGCCDWDKFPFCVGDSASGDFFGSDKDIDFEVERCLGC